MKLKNFIELKVDKKEEKWESVLSKNNISDEELFSFFKEDVKKKFNEWESFKKLIYINALVGNNIKYLKDINGDYWQAPKETLELKKGDCEDIAILKYFILRKLGISEKDLRIVILQDILVPTKAHAFLIINFEDEVYILDNDVKGIKKGSNLSKYKPIYSVNETSYFVFAKTSSK